MECRCYRGGDGRTKLHVLHYDAKDFMMMAVVVLFGVVLIGLNMLAIGYTM
jgi:energy-coupling factor transport system permease protein